MTVAREWFGLVLGDGPGGRVRHRPDEVVYPLPQRR